MVGANPTRDTPTWPDFNGSSSSTRISTSFFLVLLPEETEKATMEASLCRVPSLWTVGSRTRQSKSTVGFVSSARRQRLIRNRRLRTPVESAAAVDGVAAVVAEPGKVEMTWQIIVGAIAGVTPFIVAGVEFSKRIIEQKKCEECGGSGLVLIDEDYFRCPQCGGFLPWQSWRRFFSG